MKQDLHPLKFAPILKEKIWGGSKLGSILDKPSKAANIGESWEISDVDGDTSIVSQGSLKGQSLKQLIVKYKGDLVGNRVYNEFGEKFPLLIKFIDAKQDLSVQLHPNNNLAAKRHNSFGKTEMWYVMQADENANLIVGFNKKVNRQEYMRHVENKTLSKILNFESVNKGDTFFIDVGRIHAIGAGVMLAEIQQTSDITYRVYDWDRVDAQGNSRELHKDLALEAIDFNMDDDFKVSYSDRLNTSNQMVKCPYFTTNFLEVEGEVSIANSKDSFMIYICVEGEVKVDTNQFEELLKKGETVLIPSSLKNFRLISKGAKLLEVYV